MLSYNLICLALAAFMAKTVSSAAVASSSDASGTTSSVVTSSDASGTTSSVVTSSGASGTTSSVVTSSPATTSAVTSTAPIPSTVSASSAPPPTASAPPSFLIHPNGNILKCLDVRGALLQNGTPVQIFDCNSTPAQNWIIGPGEGHVQLAGTNFCLDAGSSPANGVGMKIWQCFNNLPAQDWFYTNDDRIALTNQGLCLDLTNGDLTNSNRVQTFKCTDNNVNQVWTVSPGITIPA